MTETFAISRLLQYGVETTEGVLVPATKQLATLQIVTTVHDSANSYMPSGYQADTVTQFDRAYTTGRVTGKPTFGELIVPASGMFGAPTPTIPTGGTLARQWLFNFRGNVIDVPTPLSFEHGDASQCDVIPGNVFSDFGLTFDRGTTDFAGATLGRQLDPTGTLTGALSPLETTLIPLTGSEIDVYVDTTSAGLGGTKFLRAFRGGLSITGKSVPAWVLNSALTSFGVRSPVAPRRPVQLTLGMDAQGRSTLAALRQNTRQFVRVKWTGPIIEAAIPYSVTADVAVDVTGVGDEVVIDGYYCRQFTGNMVHDPTFGSAMKLAVVNKLTAL